MLATFPWIFLGITLFPMWEAVYATLFTLLLAWVMHDVLSQPCPIPRIVAAGILWGVRFLINPVSFFLFLAWAFWTFRSATISAAKKLLLVAIHEEPAVIAQILAHLEGPGARDGPAPAATVSSPLDDPPMLPF